MGSTYPVGIRALAAAGAVGSALLFGVVAPGGLLRGGFPVAAAAAVAALVPFFAFLALLALAPGLLQRVLARFTRVDLRDGGHVAAVLVMAFALYLVFGLGSLVGGVQALEASWQGRSEEVLGAVSPEGLMLGLTQNLIVLTVPPLVYVSFVHGHGPRGALRDLGLRGEGAGPAALGGIALAFLVVLGIGVLSFLATQAGLVIPENDLAVAIARNVTVPGALAIAAVSAISEEVFFRGFLQPRVGLVAQAVLFSLAHLSYANVLELVVTFSLALAFGLMRRRAGNLWAPVAAHFMFNLLMLLGAIAGEAFAPAENATAPAWA